MGLNSGTKLLHYRIVDEFGKAGNEGGAQHYRLTRKGADLFPVMLNLLRWSVDHEKTGVGGELVELLRRSPKQVERELRRRLVLAE